MPGEFEIGSAKYTAGTDLNPGSYILTSVDDNPVKIKFFKCGAFSETVLDSAGDFVEFSLLENEFFEPFGRVTIRISE